MLTVTALPTLGDPVCNAKLILETLACALPAEIAGTTDNIPKPNADTATSAIRLIDVFVDIIFLSKVIRAYFARTAWVLETGS
jgi:hypothetical protein